MADPIVSFITENDKAFKKLLDKMGENISDFRIPFNLISNHFYKGNRKLFTLKSEGLYPVLGGFNPRDKIIFKGQPTTKQEAAEVTKSEAVGFIFPLLKRRGALAKSLSGRNAPGAEHFIGRQSLIMGTNISYAKFHQSDRTRKKIPQRKMIFIDGGPAERSRSAIISGRLEAWTNIVSDYVAQVISGEANI